MMRNYTVAFIDNTELANNDIARGVSKNLTEFWWVELGAQI